MFGMRHFTFSVRRCFQLSLRTLFVAIAVICALLAREINYYRQQEIAIRGLAEAGATVVVRRSVPMWLFELSGRRWRYVYAIHQSSCSETPAISDLTEFEPAEQFGDIHHFFMWGVPQ